METTSRQRLPYELTSRRDMKGRKRQEGERDVGQIFEYHGKKFIVFRQLKRAKIPCEGCYFYEGCIRDRECPPLCEGYKRADKLDVIFKRLQP